MIVSLRFMQGVTVETKYPRAANRDIVLVYFDKGVLTGDWDGPHISPIATYDVDLRHVLIMDVDRQWYIPHWSSDELKLIECGGTLLHPKLSRNAERAARSQNKFEFDQGAETLAPGAAPGDSRRNQ